MNHMASFEPVLTNHVREPNSYTLDFYLKHARGYEGLRKALTLQAERHHRAGEGVGAARPRRRRVPDRAEVAVRPQGHAEAEVHRLQRRRERAGHVQGSRADGAQPAPAHRGVRDRLLRDRREGRLHLHPRRVLPRAGDARARDRRGLQGRLSRQEHPRQRLRLRRLRASRRRRLRSRRGDRAHRIARRQARAAAHQAAVSRRSPASISARPRSTTSRRSATCRSIVLNGAEWFAGARSREERRPEAVLHQRPREAAGRLRSVDAHDAARADLRRAVRAGHARRPHVQGDHPRRIVGADPARRAPRHAGQLRSHPEGRIAARLGRPHRAWTTRSAWCGWR